MPIRNILFDLDGTLTDPAEGIVKSIQFSLNELNLPCPPAERLTSYIGPPLRECFSDICNSNDETFIEEAVAVFRKRFSTVGLFENTVYRAVPEMLCELNERYRLFVATSKPKIYADKILNHFGLGKNFTEIHGNDLQGSLDDKAEIVKDVLTTHSLLPAETIMIGDRRHDVMGAKRNCVSSLGVTYGYGSREELVAAGADFICNTPQEVVKQLSTL